MFSMYTQNGNPNRNLEAVITNTFWPDWLAQKEQKYQNPSFIPIEFVASPQAMTQTQRCCSPRPLRFVRLQPISGAASSAIARQPGSARLPILRESFSTWLFLQMQRD